MNETVLTILALVTVVALPGVVGSTTGMRRGDALVKASMAATAIAFVWAIYWIALANPRHVKHAVLFLGLAVVGLVASSFSRPLQSG
jgi:hypothetical protein